ncbi:hypothetical protein [Polynucleobacter sp. MG-27-Goln-C1]|uniref:hypothetical protein n=1 Tax=Polynucleobacter sp. MG-27-Goln-C1 TaxID=1819726 RepID=UPI001C0ABB30|nr:hypothetical protein [Polynucleobacter sp. MG-27-Goln-C1]
MKSNLSRILHQPESIVNLAQSDPNQQLLASELFQLRTAANTFVVDSKFALKLDEII